MTSVPIEVRCDFVEAGHHEIDALTFAGACETAPEAADAAERLGALTCLGYIKDVNTGQQGLVAWCASCNTETAVRTAEALRAERCEVCGKFGVLRGARNVRA